MARQKIIAQVQRYPLEMTNAELRATFGHMPMSGVMRAILLAEVEAIRNGKEQETRTMRNLWYDVVKPVLSRAGILNKKTRGGKDVPWSDKLSIYLAEMVREGKTTYEELLIVDGSRQRQVSVAITRTVANVQLVGAHFPWVILFSEKDTIWGEIQTIAELYGVSAISGGGEPSNACTENTVREIVRSAAYRREQPEKIMILALTDYDPAGYNIAQAQFNQVSEAANGLDSAALLRLQTVTHTRLGILSEQLTPEERQAKAYEPKDDGLDKWFAQTGGVDGQPLGLELDALPLSRLRRMFAEGIEQRVDMGKRREDLRSAFVELIAADLLAPDYEAKRRAMLGAVRSNGLWRAIENTPIPEDLFLQAALEGQNCIDPVSDTDLFDGHKAAVKEAMSEAVA